MLIPYHTIPYMFYVDSSAVSDSGSDSGSG